MRIVIVSLLLAVGVAACSDGTGPTASPTSPTAASVPVATAPAPPLAVQSISSVPEGTGVQFNTDFQFTATGTFPAGTEFVWTFGDGSATTTNTPTVSRIYGQSGVFGVNVTARRGGDTASAARSVSVRSMLGRWFGKVTGFTHFPLQRPVAMTSFELQVTNQTLAGNSLMLQGRWADDAGCRETRAEYVRQRIDPSPTVTVTFGVNQLYCADGDFYLTGTADGAFNRVDGSCDVAGNNPNCRFTMTRE